MMQRYEPCIDKGAAGMTECINGDYVLYADHVAALTEERANVIAYFLRINELEEQLRLANIDCFNNEAALGGMDSQQVFNDIDRRKTIKELRGELETTRTYNLELQEKLERRAEHVVRLRDALDRIESLSTIETVEISRIAREALDETPDS